MAKRLIFEEVDTRDDQKPLINKSHFRSERGQRNVRIWLLGLLALTAMTIVVGGLTRLTDSGLSMTEWEPLRGVFPPFSETVWQSEFKKYQQTTEFRLQNFDMSLSAFKVIYWWEWGHRQFGRLVGLTWAIGFVWFAIGKHLTTPRLKRLLVVGSLIGVQGAIGWWMVSSGFAGDAIDVAPYRLAIHLALAFSVAGLTFWEILLLSRPPHILYQSRRFREIKLEIAATIMILLILMQLVAGALVAGNDAGLAFPTWPLMNSEFLPSNSFNMTPWWSNFISNVSLVHFNHRILGYLTVLFSLFLWVLSRRIGNAQTRGVFTIIFFLVLAQTILGILTALWSATLPLAIVHQFGALILFLVVIWGRFMARYPRHITR